MKSAGLEQPILLSIEFKSIPLWIRATRMPFLQASVLPVILGSALAYQHSHFDGVLFLLMLMAIGAIHIGTNLINDYFDHKSGADERNLNPTPFSGGSRVIQEGVLAPQQLLRGALVAYSVGFLLGFYLLMKSDWGLLFFGLGGIILGFFYTAPPLKLGYRGWGEPLVGLLLGPMAVMGSYYVLTGEVSPQAFWLSLPLGFMVMAILYVNEFPDALSDRQVGKMHWVARLGRRRALPGYIGILVASYAGVLTPVLMGILTPWTLLSFLSLPIAIRAAQILIRHYNDPAQLIPAMGFTIVIHLVMGVSLSFGLIISSG